MSQGNMHCPMHAGADNSGSHLDDHMASLVMIRLSGALPAAMKGGRPVLPHHA